MVTPPHAIRDQPATQTLGDERSFDELAPALRGGFAPATPGRYLVEDELARGSYGRVMRARDVELNRIIAIKELLPEARHARARFEREGLLAAQLQHPSIIPVYDTGCWPSGAPFIAMKLVTGATLQARLDAATGVTERLVLVSVVIAVAEAIAYAHGARIVHRDLKPANILVGEFGEVVVIDWGLAEQLDAARPLVAAAGTPAYLAPEQAAGAPPDTRTDVFALGAILHHVLAGEPPVPARSLQEAATASPRTIPDDVSAELRTIAARAMAKLPGDRYPSARELAADLQRFQAGQLVSAHEYSLWALFARFVRRNRAAVSIAAILLTAMAVVAVVSIQRIRRANDDAMASAAHARVAAERATDALARKEGEERARKAAEATRAATEAEKQKVQHQVELDQTTIQQSREELVARNKELQRALAGASAASEAERAANAKLESANAQLEKALARERARSKELEDRKKSLATHL